MTDVTLLPPNATTQEREVEASTARVGAVPIPIRSIWNAQTCPAALLPWLAWSLAVGEWDSQWPEATKRAVIAASAVVHKLKGTVYSVKAALAAAGYPGAEIIEGDSSNKYDGTIPHDGKASYGHPTNTNWAYYRVRLQTPISNAQADQVKRILNVTAPARCVLVGLEFTRVAATYNAAIKYDGTFNYGIAS